MPDPKRFTADINLTVDELSELCDLTSDAVINGINGSIATSPQRLLILRSLFAKAHNAWQQQIIEPGVGEIIAQSVRTGQPVPHEVTAFLTGGRIPLEVPSDDPHTCGHFHAEGAPCPSEGNPCGDYRCCH